MALFGVFFCFFLMHFNHQAKRSCWSSRSVGNERIRVAHVPQLTCWSENKQPSTKRAVFIIHQNTDENLKQKLSATTAGELLRTPEPPHLGEGGRTDDSGLFIIYHAFVISAVWRKPPEPSWFLLFCPDWCGRPAALLFLEGTSVWGRQ